jgi:hypothetical protein
MPIIEPPFKSFGKRSRPSEWAPACWVRRLVKPLLVLPDEFQDVEKISERAKEFSNQQRHASLLSRQTDAGRIGEEAA